MKPPFHATATAAALLAALGLAAAAQAQERPEEHRSEPSKPAQPRPPQPQQHAPQPQGQRPQGPQNHQDPQGPQGHTPEGRAPQGPALQVRANPGPQAPKPTPHGANQGQQGPASQGRGPQDQRAPGQQPPSQGQRGGAAHGPAAGNARFDRRANPQQWKSARTDWRSSHANFAAQAPWRQNHDWWRGRSEFRGYSGRRNGFWFAPGFGYYNVPQVYWGRTWNDGDYLPNVFWRYQVANYGAYDLPPPPFGCAWIWVNGGVVLIDLSDGYIMDVETGLY